MATKRSEKEREFEFTNEAFNQVCSLVKSISGIVLADGKQDMVYGRLSRRLRALDLPDIDSYLKLVKCKNSEELIHFTNALTTNLTSFFREAHHFEFLKSDVFPELMKKNSATKKIRIWSAGCSTGEEPYSIGMTALDFFSSHTDWDVRIIATDLDSNVVKTGKDGIYPMSRIEGVLDKYKKRWIKRGKGDKSDFVKMSSELQSIITFKQLNLLGVWPITGPLDVIFCRNVVIYFDKETQKVLFDRYANILNPDTHLFIGHSENMFNVCNRFRSIGNTIYQKTQ